MSITPVLQRVPAELAELLRGHPNVLFARDMRTLAELATPPGRTVDEVAYEIPGLGRVVEATVSQMRNGVSVNYLDPYMRRRDPDCMLVADDQPTNKKRFEDRLGYPFECLRDATFDWLSRQELIVFAFAAGGGGAGVDSLVVCPRNAAFFAYALALLQGVLDIEELSEDFSARSVVYVAPPFRHTHFDGRQIVVHNRRSDVHELFSYNLYPGPSAKKGVYGVLINAGEKEGWVTAHCSTVQVVTPYDNTVTFMHEGASGGGKSEMLEGVHREADGRLLLGENIVTGERKHLVLPRACELRPVTDDMALCLPSLGEGEDKLTLLDAEAAWFVRVNHIRQYGTDPNLEKLTISPKEPLVFLSLDTVPGSTALIWEHQEDAPGKPCPNPRVILPRRIVPNVVDGPVSIDIRSFGVRTPPCTAEDPTYGILGMFHILPPALAWLWRLVAPRGHDNPSVVGGSGMGSEGVGSYWPFATGRRVDQANLLLRQIVSTSKVNYILCPNQHVGAWKTGFMPQWIAREYLARRGHARFRGDQVAPARCSLLGWAIKGLQVEGAFLPRWFFEVDQQPEVGPEAYDAGAKQLEAFFAQCLEKFLEPDLDPLGRRIIEACLRGEGVDEMAAML